MAMGRKSIGFAQTLKVSIGQIIQGDSFLERKEIPLSFVQVSFYGSLILEQLIRDFVHAIQAEIVKIIVNQLAKTRSILKPFMCCQFTARLTGSANYRSDGSGRLLSVKPPVLSVSNQALATATFPMQHVRYQHCAVCSPQGCQNQLPGSQYYQKASAS